MCSSCILDTDNCRWSLVVVMCFFFKQKTAYDMRISDWSSDVCSSDLGDKPEEGGDDVKSSWPLRPGLHTYYNGRYRGLQYREVEPIPESRSQSGSESATRLREVGIERNRGSDR